jgi:hypothetical protein
VYCHHVVWAVHLLELSQHKLLHAAKQRQQCSSTSPATEATEARHCVLCEG